jgi:pimeloyl-ACP methyl ester carboxylesterase
MSTRFRRLLVAATAAALVASLTVGALPSRGAGEAPADPELGTLIAGEESFAGGTHVWTDYAYDDRGPNNDGLAGGDGRYPANPYPGNTADLIQLQLGTDTSGNLTIATVLETLVDGAEALIGVAFDTDGDPGTGATTVPGGQWKNREPLGLEQLVLLGTDGTGSLRTWNGGAWTDAGAVDVGVDRARNLVSATVPALQPGTATWNAVGVAGMQDGGGGSWLNGAQPIYDLAYVRAEDPVNEVAFALREQVPQLGFVPYQDKDQADILVGAIGAHRAVSDVRFGTGATQEPAVRQGFNAFLYHSRAPVPEGVQNEPLIYNGPYMPYAVWVPPNLPASPPLLVFLHGANQYQNVNLVHFNNPQSQLVKSSYDVPAVVIFPNGRTTGWGSPLADRDALDSIADALARPALNLDADRVVLSGVSSGGAGTFRLASRYPDLFTGAYSLVGGGTTLLENLTNLPFRASNGLADPLVNVNTWRTSADALKAAGTVDYRIVLVHNRSHDGPLAEGNCYYLDLLSRDRVKDPARVRFTTPASDKAIRDLGLQPTGAYWVSAMTARDDAQRAGLDAESLARPARVVANEILEVNENLTKTADFCGPHPNLRGGNNWSIEGRSFTTAQRDAVNGMTVALANLASATIDANRAGLDSSAPLELRTTGDGTTVLTLVGSWPGTVRILRDGEEVAQTEASDGRITFEVAGGTHRYTVQSVDG